MAKWMVRYPDGATVEIEADEVKLSSGLNLYKDNRLVAHFPIEASAILGGAATTTGGSIPLSGGTTAKKAAAND